MVAIQHRDDRGDSLELLALGLRQLQCNDSLTERRDRLIDLIDNFLIPRSNDPGHPVDVVFFGPTGSGKSTLFNSLARSDVSATGAIRPTTAHPVVLTTTSRVDGYTEKFGATAEVHSGAAPILDQMTLVDTPDIDSTAVEHRLTAERLVDCADVVVLVVSASRYADLVPWQVLRRAVSRGATLVVVLNRVTGRTAAASHDFRRLLKREGLDDSLVVVNEQPGGWNSGLPSLAVHGLARRLATIASQANDERDGVWRRSFDFVVAESRQLSEQVAVDIAQQVPSQASDHARISLEAMNVVDRVPEGVGRFGLRRWAKRAKRKVSDVDGYKSELQNLLTQSIQDQVGSLETSVVSRELGGWLDFAERMVDSTRRRHRLPHLIVLTSDTLWNSVSEASRRFFGESAEEFVDRSSRELSRRVEVLETLQMAIDASRDLKPQDGGVAEISKALGLVSGDAVPANA